MASQPVMSSRSPPPLQHPKPTHPAYPPPEPPHTPGRSSASSPYSQTGRLSQDLDGYTRYSSPPVGGDPAHAAQQQQQQQPLHGFIGSSSSAYASAPAPAPGMHARGYGAQGPNAPMGYGGNMFPLPGMNDATTQMGVQFGRSAFTAGSSYMQENVLRYLPLPMVKTCFSVTNSYVLRKLRIVLFPWRHRPWSRQVLRAADTGGIDGWQPPRDDINAPDLYIPSMALVTYMLLFATARGLQSKFKPEVMGESLTRAVLVVMLEFVGIKLGCYFLDVRDSGGASSVELIAYGGYKFVGIIATIIVMTLKVGTAANWVVFFYTFCANAFFLLRSLKYVLLPDPNASNTSVATLSHRQRSQRVQFLFVVAMTQVVWMWWLSRV